jgi:hypothetical protein
MSLELKDVSGNGGKIIFLFVIVIIIFNNYLNYIIKVY